MALSAVLALLTLATGLLGDAPAERYPRPELLIEAADLAKPEVRQRFRILDARGRNKYLAGHIPAAVWVDHVTWSRAFAAGQDPADWSRRLGALGIELTTPVVVYDDALGKDAARIWWILRFWGVRDVRLLNGGWTAWQQGNTAASKEEPAVAPTAPRLEARPERLATKEQVLATLKDRSAQIIDARSRDEYCGVEKTARRNGAIPGARHLEWSDLLDKQTQRFKSPAEMARLFKDAGIDLGRPAVAHCQSGGRSSVMAFALELMGAKDVRNYYRSWAEWGNADDTPIETPPRK
jgi:thiosulfate/3-mercaptopyruvate sulfurtransferase